MNLDYFWDRRIGPVLVIRINEHNFGLCLCHRMKERSIWFFGLEKYLCARCLGILLGGLLGILLFRVLYQIPPIGAFLLLIPMLIDGFSQAFGWRDSTNQLRLITGFLFGLGMAPVLEMIFS